jgi:hypothetical protein
VIEFAGKPVDRVTKGVRKSRGRRQGEGRDAACASPHCCDLGDARNFNHLRKDVHSEINRPNSLPNSFSEVPYIISSLRSASVGTRRRVVPCRVSNARPLREWRQGFPLANDRVRRRRLSTDAANLARRLVLAQPFVDDMAQQPVGRPGQVGDFGYQLRPHPMRARKHERRAEPSGFRRRNVD